MKLSPGVLTLIVSFLFVSRLDPSHASEIDPDSLSLIRHDQRYATGEGCEKDTQLAIQYYKKAIERGNALSMFLLAQVYDGETVNRNENKKSAFYWYKRAAENNVIHAMTPLADCLQKGDGCKGDEQDKREALSWLQKAGDEGLCRLGQAYAHGIGCMDNPKRFEIAVQFFEEAVKKGNKVAMWDYAGFIRDKVLSIGTRSKNEKRIFYLYQALVDDFPKAKTQLAICMQRGIGCEGSESDKKKALALLKDATKLGDPDAFFWLASAYDKGIGCNDVRDRDQLAFQYYNRSCKLGYATAMNNIAIFLDEGRGCTRDRKQAIDLWVEASRRGCLIALMNLGRVHFFDKDFTAALKYFNMLPEGTKPNKLIGYIYFQDKKYKNALDAYILAQKENEEVSKSLILYLEKKVKQLNKAPHSSKKQVTAGPQKDPHDLIAKSLERTTKKAEDLYKKLKKQLTSMISNEDFDAPKLLQTMNTIYHKVRTDMENIDDAQKLQKNKQLLQYLRNIDEKRFISKEKQDSEKKAAEMRERARADIGAADPFEIEKKSRAPSEEKRERRANLKKTLQGEKDLNRKHSNRKHEKSDTKKAKKAKQEKQENNNDTRKVVTPERIKGPFADIGTENRSNAELREALMENVYEILDTIRESTDMNDAIYKLKEITGGKDFKEIKPEYGGFPKAHKVFQMRISGQYRVIIAFEEVTEEVLPPSINGQNSNNPVKQITYKLWGDKIYIDDPHKK